MSSFAKISFIVLFFITVFMAPWWSTVFVGLIFVSLFPGFFAAGTLILGGILMDALFGAPMRTLFGFEYLYTTVFFLMGGIALFLKNALSE